MRMNDVKQTLPVVSTSKVEGLCEHDEVLPVITLDLIVSPVSPANVVSPVILVLLKQPCPP